MIQNEVMIEFKNVSKTYKLYKNDQHRLLSVFYSKVPCSTKLASDNLSFVIRKGESVAFFGRNGAGKSTILKLITKTAFPESGEVIVNGRVSALLGLTAGFDPEFTGRENIYLKGQLMGLHRSEIEAIEAKIIDFADIGEYVDQPTRTYSSGMRARLGFAVCVSTNPEILIVDEALSVGDADFRQKCLERITHMIEDENITLLFVTHAEQMAEQFCDRGIFLQNGRIICDGPVHDAYEKYMATGTWKKKGS